MSSKTPARRRRGGSGRHRPSIGLARRAEHNREDRAEQPWTTTAPRGAVRARRAAGSSGVRRPGRRGVVVRRGRRRSTRTRCRCRWSPVRRWLGGAGLGARCCGPACSVTAERPGAAQHARARSTSRWPRSTRSWCARCWPSRVGEQALRLAGVGRHAAPGDGAASRVAAAAAPPATRRRASEACDYADFVEAAAPASWSRRPATRRGVEPLSDEQLALAADVRREPAWLPIGAGRGSRCSPSWSRCSSERWLRARPRP